MMESEADGRNRSQFFRGTNGHFCSGETRSTVSPVFMATIASTTVPYSPDATAATTADPTNIASFCVGMTCSGMHMNYIHIDLYKLDCESATHCKNKSDGIPLDTA